MMVKVGTAEFELSQVAKGVRVALIARPFGYETVATRDEVTKLAIALLAVAEPDGV